MNAPRIFAEAAAAVERAGHDIAAHLPHHHDPAPPTGRTTMTTFSPVIDAIEADFHKYGKSVDNDVHGILAHHLTIEKMAKRVFETLTAIQGSPLAGLVEDSLGVDPAIVSKVANYGDALLTDFTSPALSQPPVPAATQVLPQPENVPAA